jgi:hypothetical protein
VTKRAKPPLAQRVVLPIDERLREWLNSPQQRELRERFREWANSPLIRQQNEQLRRLSDSPVIRKLHEHLTRERERREVEQLREMLEREALEREAQEQREALPPRKRRQKGGGRKRKLTQDQIERGRQMIRRTLRKNQKLTKKGAVKLLKEKGRPAALRKVGRGTLLTHIIWPVLGKASRRVKI